jgi:uncharacterized membrane protein
VEILGAIVLVGATIILVFKYLCGLVFRRAMPDLKQARQGLARRLMLGLEILIVAEVLRTILRPDLEDIVLLVIIVILRIALSLSLEYELRQLPWEDDGTSERPAGG